MENIYFLHTAEDTPFIKAFFAPLCFGKANVWLNSKQPDMVMEVTTKALAKGCTKIITTSQRFLELLRDKPASRKTASLDKYAGSIFHAFGCEILILDPLKHLVSVSYGKFLCERFLSKLLNPSDWMQVPPFRWELFEPQKVSRLQSLFQTALFISVDIETDRTERGTITCIGFTAIHAGARGECFTASTVVVPFTDLYNVAFARTILGLPIPKVFQNGKYDNVYLLRYNCITYNWLLDTAHMFHSWYSELPKDLGLLTAFCIRDWIYHKDDGDEANTEMEYYEYNARDCYTTAIDIICMLNEIPPFAWDNFLMEFPQVFPCLLAELTGIPIDPAAQTSLSAELYKLYKDKLYRVRTMLNCQFFNPASPAQVAKVFDLLGSGDIKQTSKIPMDKVKSRHPLNKVILTKIENYRKEKKRDDTYVGKDFIWNSRCLYALGPHWTATGRYASKESSFWCGLQIQNIPREPEPGEPNIKSMFIADPDFWMGECDGEQAEARCVAYTSGDTNLIATVEGARDYHGVNAERFFGIPYDKIIGPDGKVINKPIRQLSKNVNHGSNYNMGAGVLIDTMGIDKIIIARQLLGLPAHFTLKQVATHLLSTYASAYPTVKGAGYDKVRSDVMGSGLLIGATGWTRRCFGNPVKNKRDMNAYAAHVGQSLFAMILNKAWWLVFAEVAMKEPKDFRLLAQIHDSILFMYRKGREDLAWKVKELMEISIPVTDVFGKKRDMLIPCELKGGGDRWSTVEKMRKVKS